MSKSPRHNSTTAPVAAGNRSPRGTYSSGMGPGQGDNSSPRISPRDQIKRQMSVLQSKLKKSTTLAAGATDEAVFLTVEEGQTGLARGLGEPGLPHRVALLRENESCVVLSVDGGAFCVARTPGEVNEALETLLGVFPEAAWPEAGAPLAVFLEAASADEAVARSGELRELLLEPGARPPLGAARAAGTRAGPLVVKGKRRLAVLLGPRLLLYREDADERAMPRAALSLFLACLELEGPEIRVECLWEPRRGSVRLRAEDRRDALAWLAVLREARHRLLRPLFFREAADALPRSVAQLFEPLPALTPDLAWRPSLSERWWPEDGPATLRLNKEGRVRAASPAKLVEKLLDETLMSHADVVSFLLTFESFLTPLELLDALASHFDRPQRGAEGFKMRPEQLRVITVVGKWLETCPQQFVTGDPLLAARLFGWLEWNFREDRPQPYRKLLKAGRLVYRHPEDTPAAAPAAAAAPSPAVVSPGAPAASSEREALRAAVRARMAAQAAVLGDRVSGAAASHGSLHSGAASAGSSPALRASAATSSAALRASTAGARKGSVSSEPAPASGSPTGALERASSQNASGDLRGSLSLSLSGSGTLLAAAAVPEPALPAAWAQGPCQDLFEVPAVEVARQITLLEFALFAATPLVELHGRGWLDGGAACPQLMRGIAFFNYLSHAVPMTVLRSPLVAQRAAMVAWWLRVAAELRALNNFSSVVAVMGGFAMSAAYRLVRTWAALERAHPREHASLPGLQSLTSSASNWVALRGALHSVSPPAIPYLGIYTSDLTFADQGNPSRLDGLVNWDKCKLEASIIRDVHLFQQTPYALAPVPALQALLWSLASDSDDALYELSLMLEPRRK